MSLPVVQALIQTEPLGVVVGVVAGLLPYLLVIGAFAFLYLFIPNTPVRLRAALAGGAVGGLLWQSAGWVFATFVAASTSYTAIYSSFAIIILFMIWLYVSWLVLLVGAAIAFYVQHPQSLRPATAGTISNRMREQLAVAVAALIGERFRSGLPPLTRAQLAQAIRAPEHVLDPVLVAMRHARLLLCTRDQPTAWVPARDIASITLDELMHAVRAAGETRHFDGAGFVLPPQAQRAFERMEGAIADALRGNTMASLAEGSGHAARATPDDVQHDAAHESAQRAPHELSKPTTGHP
jgi:membrane protein